MTKLHPIQQLRAKIPISVLEAKTLLEAGNSLEKIEREFIDKQIKDVLISCKTTHEEAEDALRKNDFSPRKAIDFLKMKDVVYPVYKAEPDVLGNAHITSCEPSIKNIREAIVECHEEFNHAQINKENCLIYKDKLMEAIKADISNLRATLDFENRFYDLIEGDVDALDFGNEPKPYRIGLLLYAATIGQLKVRLTPQDEVILDVLYRAAQAVYEYGNAYCKLSPNSTSFIEDNFGDDARSITENVYISPSMSDFLHGIQQTWHWHGH